MAIVKRKPHNGHPCLMYISRMVFPNTSLIDNGLKSRRRGWSHRKRWICLARSRTYPLRESWPSGALDWECGRGKTHRNPGVTPSCRGWRPCWQWSTPSVDWQRTPYTACTRCNCATWVANCPVPPSPLSFKWAPVTALFHTSGTFL